MKIVHTAIYNDNIRLLTVELEDSASTRYVVQHPDGRRFTTDKMERAENVARDWTLPLAVTRTEYGHGVTVTATLVKWPDMVIYRVTVDGILRHHTLNAMEAHDAALTLLEPLREEGYMLRFAYKGVEQTVYIPTLEHIEAARALMPTGARLIALTAV